jgi:hypothetical protein
LKVGKSLPEDLSSQPFERRVVKSIAGSNSDVVRLSHAVSWPFGGGPALLEPCAAVARLRVPAIPIINHSFKVNNF